MTRAKVKITPLVRRSSNRQRSSDRGLHNDEVCKDPDCWNLNTENCPPNLDFDVIEEIANGVEKMILSWSHLDEGEKMQKSGVREDEKLVTPEKESLSMIWKLPEDKKVAPDSTRSRKKESSEEFCVQTESDISLPKQSQIRPEEVEVSADGGGSVTTEISVDDSCPGGGMGHDISKVVTETVTHSGSMVSGDAQTEKTLTKNSTQGDSDGRQVPLETAVSTDEAGHGQNSGDRDGNAESTSPSQNLHLKRSRESRKLPRKEVSTSGQASSTHSSPRTPPISERSVKRMQYQEEESSNRNLELSVSKKTRWSEKPTTVPISGAYEVSKEKEDEECMKSPKSDCSLLDLTSNSSWNDPLVGSPIRKPSALPMDHGEHIEEFGPWDNVSGHAPVIVSRVTARPDSDLEHRTKEKTSFVSFKLWKANKQSESGLEGNVSEIGLKREETSRQSVPQGSTDNHDCGVAAQDLIAPQTSDSQLNGDRNPREMEELQIALLECATEYEIKTIEMKMKLKSIKKLKCETSYLDPQPTTSSEVSDVTASIANKPTGVVSADQLPEDEMQQMERVKRQVYKLQHQKRCLSKELADLKKKERQFELQKKSLDAALHKLNRLEWEMIKKEQEVEDWQLRQRHAETQLQDSVVELQRLTTLSDIEDMPMDTASLLSLLPTLRGFVQTLAQKENGREYYSDDQSQQDDTICDPSDVDEIVSNLMHDIQGLQYELNGIMSQNGNVCKEPKPKKIVQRQNNVAYKPPARHSPRLPRDRYPYPRLNAA